MAKRHAVRWGLTLLVGSVLLGAGATPALGCDASNQHQFGLSPGCLDLRIADAPIVGNAAPDYFQAGGHPYEVISSIILNAPAASDPVFGEYWPQEAVKDLFVQLPPGLVADPPAVPPCSLEQLAGANGNSNCPADSQVGILTVFSPGVISGLFSAEIPFYRMIAPPGVPARFGFNQSGSPVTFEGKISPGGDGQLSIDLTRMNETTPIAGMRVALWGVPGDPAHTPKRACPGQVPPTGNPLGGVGPACAATLPPRPFLRLPTSCGVPANLSVKLDSWPHPGSFQEGSILTHASPGLIGDPTAGGAYPAPYPGLAAEQWGSPRGFTGCGQTPFNPSLTVGPTSQMAGGPTGLDIEMKLPQQGLDEAGAVSESDLEEAVTTLPAGLSLNPSVANGLTACTPAQAELDASGLTDCPDSSKLGTVEIVSPLLGGPLTGSIFDAERGPGQGAATLPAYIVAGEGGMAIKLFADVAVDKGGHLTARFGESPQIPIERIGLHFFGGERAPFVNPGTCGSYVASARFTPWSGTGAVDASDAFAITSGAHGGPCVSDSRNRPFKPGFRAGSTSPVAGASSALTIKLTREDGEQELSGLEMSFPPGISASLGSVPTCPDAAIAAAAGREGAAEAADPSCPSGSRVGAAIAAVGAGSEPFYMKSGRVYLAGPYEGAGFSLVVIIPGTAGPIDLGTIAMRLPLKVDPGSGRLAMKTQLPSAQNGVRLNLRQMTLNIDRPGFITNPTNCRPSSVDALIEGDGGATASVSSPFQVLGCASLRFNPSLRMKVLGKASATRHIGHPAIRTVLKLPAGSANIKRASIVFPDSEQLDPAHIRSVCKESEFAAHACPKDSIYGYAKIATPLFDTPLAGPLYMRSSSHKLPDLVAALSGKLDLNLEAKIGFVDGRLSVDLGSLPDVPVSKLTLTTRGGRRGLFVNNRNLCAASSVSTASLTAQNGKLSKRQAKLEVPCG